MTSILDKAGRKNGKLDSPSPPAQPPKCSECASRRVWRDGIRHTNHGDVQRYLCRSCGYRFSDPKVKVHVTTQRLKMPNSRKDHVQTSIFKSDSPLKKTPEKSSLFIGEDIRPHFSSPQGSVTEGLNSLRFYNSKHQVCVNEEKMKNLVKVETRQKQAAGATTADVKGKVFDFGWQLKKNGYSESTVKLYMRFLTYLVKQGANILNPDSVKEVIAQQQDWSQATKKTVAAAYTKFLETSGKTWTPPKCTVTRKIPFIPTEREIDKLISACGKKTAVFLACMHNAE